MMTGAGEGQAMTTLYAIEFRHHSQKDSESGIKRYVLADDAVVIRDRLDKDEVYTSWSDHDPIPLYDEDYNEAGEENYMDRMLRLRGEINDEDFDGYDDLYYGLTLWGWSEGQDITDADAEVLLRLGIAEDWRVETKR